MLLCPCQPVLKKRHPPFSPSQVTTKERVFVKKIHMRTNLSHSCFSSVSEGLPFKTEDAA